MTREEEIKKASQEFAQSIASIRPELNADSFRRGAEWADKTMIEKAFEWLCANMVDNTYLGAKTLRALNKAEFIQNFKKAMEE